MTVPAFGTIADKHRPFTALGIPVNASDELVKFAYHKQVETDVAQAPWYLSYLDQIANNRGSEDLLTVVAIERSDGRVDLQQLSEAYQYFGLRFDSLQTDDDHIIGSFKSRVQDSPMHETQMRERLRIIGKHRKSTKIQDYADDCMRISFLHTSFN
jgi:ubiquitin carboxyl-terminal hydrolase 25